MNEMKIAEEDDREDKQQAGSGDEERQDCPQIPQEVQR